MQKYAEMEKEWNSVENSNEKERRNMTEQELHSESLESVRHSHSEQCAAFTAYICYIDSVQSTT